MTIPTAAYDEGIAWILGLIVATGDDLVVQLVLDGYTWAAGHGAADLAGYTIGAATPVAGTLSVSGRAIVTDTPTTVIPSVPADLDDVRALAISVDGGPLLGVLSRMAGPVPLLVVTDGGDVEITWPNNTVLSLGG